jgi:hypothetical protein
MDDGTVLSVAGLDMLVRQAAQELEERLDRFEFGHRERVPFLPRSKKLRDAVWSREELIINLTAFYAERYMIVPNPGSSGGEKMVGRPNRVMGR